MQAQAAVAVAREKVKAQKQAQAKQEAQAQVRAEAMAKEHAGKQARPTVINSTKIEMMCQYLKCYFSMDCRRMF